MIVKTVEAPFEFGAGLQMDERSIVAIAVFRCFWASHSISIGAILAQEPTMLVEQS